MLRRVSNSVKGTVLCDGGHILGGRNGAVVYVGHGNAVIGNIVPDGEHSAQEAGVVRIELGGVECAGVPVGIEFPHVEVVGIVSGCRHDVGCP